MHLPQGGLISLSADAIAAFLLGLIFVPMCLLVAGVYQWGFGRSWVWYLGWQDEQIIMGVGTNLERVISYEPDTGT